MTDAIGTQSGLSLLSLLAAGQSSLAGQIQTVTQQISTGYVSDTYPGLGAGLSTSLSLQPEIATLAARQSAATDTAAQMGVAQDAMTQISSIVGGIYTAASAITSDSNPADVETLAAQARSALQQVAGLLNTQDGTSYVFAGQDSADAPVPNANAILSSGFYTQTSVAVQSLAGAGAAATEAQTLAVASSNASGTSPFSAALSQSGAALAVQQSTTTLSDGGTVVTGMLASGDPTTTVPGADTTGSYMRDMLRGLATLGSLSSSQMSASDFTSFMGDTATGLKTAMDTFSVAQGILGNSQTALTDDATAMSDTQDALTAQLSDAQDADVAKLSSQLTLLQTQLEASYSLTSRVGSLSLVNFL